MEPAELDIGGAAARPRAKRRKAALEALDRLLRAHLALGEQRSPESPYGLLRPAREGELDLIEAVFAHCGIPLPESLRAIYARTLGVGNPVAKTPVLSVPFLRAILPDEGFGPPLVGLLAFEQSLGILSDEVTAERPPFLTLGHAAPLSLAVSRNGLWSLADRQNRPARPEPQEFGLVFEDAFGIFVEQVLLIWANDMAGDPVRLRDLDLTRGARWEEMPRSVRAAREVLLAPRPVKALGEVEPFDSPDLLRATRRDASPEPGRAPASHLAVVGLPFCGHPEIAGRIGPGDLLGLRPVEDNPHDPLAVEVWTEGTTPVRIGFVPRAEAPRCRDLPGGAEGWRLRVTGRNANVLGARLEARPGDPPAAEATSEEGVDLFSPPAGPRGD